MILILTTKRLICMNEMKGLVVCSFREVSLVQNEQESIKASGVMMKAARAKGISAELGRSNRNGN